MTRHKSRVARIRRARRGTRKQSGGFDLFGWFRPKTDTDAGAKPVAVNPTDSAADDKQGLFSGFLNIFKSKKPEPKVTSAADENTGSPPPLTQPPPPTQPPPGTSSMVGGRKTRHRRRSPRRHRK